MGPHGNSGQKIDEDVRTKKSSSDRTKPTASPERNVPRVLPRPRCCCAHLEIYPGALYITQSVATYSTGPRESPSPWAEPPLTRDAHAAAAAETASPREEFVGFDHQQPASPRPSTLDKAHAPFLRLNCRTWAKTYIFCCKVLECKIERQRGTPVL